MSVPDLFGTPEMWLALSVFSFSFYGLAQAQQACENTEKAMLECDLERDQLLMQRNCLVIFCTVLIIAWTMQVWSRSRTAKMTSDNAHDSANTQDLAKTLSDVKSECEDLKRTCEYLTRKSNVFRNLCLEQHINVQYCVILLPLLKLNCMWLFKRFENFKKMIKWSLHWNLLVDAIFLYSVLFPLSAIYCLAYEIWSKQTVSPDVMLSAMNTTLKLVMKPGMMVWENIKPFVCTYCTHKDGWSYRK